MPDDDLNLNADAQGGDGGQDNSGNQGFVINDVNEVLGDLKDDAVFKPYAGQKPKDFINNIVKGYVNAQKMIGAEKVALPVGKLDNEETWNALFDKLGRPKTPDGYKFEKPELPEGLPYDENMEKAFKTICHQAGILPKQASTLYKFWNDLQTGAFNEFVAKEREAQDAAMEGLRKEMKTKDAYDEFVNGANSVLMAYGGTKEEVEAFIEKHQFDPLVIRLLGNIHKVMSEDSMKLGEKRFDLTGGDVDARMKDILHNKDNVLHQAYFNNSHPRHREAVDEVAKLMVMKHGDQPINAT